jgi:hypothetical protein
MFRLAVAFLFYFFLRQSRQDPLGRVRIAGSLSVPSLRATDRGHCSGELFCK